MQLFILYFPWNRSGNYCNLLIGLQIVQKLPLIREKEIEGGLILYILIGDKNSVINSLDMESPIVIKRTFNLSKS